MNPPDISTPETENLPAERAESRTVWRLGPLGIAAMVVLVLVDLVGPFIFPNGKNYESFMIGLSFGQMGAMILVASAASKFTWQWVVACYAATLIMCIHFAAIEGARDLDDFPMFLTIWGAYTTTALATILGLRWYHQQRSQRGLESGDEERIQFSVQHLLILTTVLAVASLVVRFAIPMLASARVEIILWLILSSVALVVTGVELRRVTHHLLWQLGGLATLALVVATIFSWANDFDEFVVAIMVQVAILALVMVVLEFERYTITVTFEPRTQPQKSNADHLTE
ncbi:hypothetical protein [Aeoliella sp. SH292]|uniref:hypothetical protein n=1 Tax=Aeoliella sp. SH292 TaxID=3454464 RepID=UPI003F9BA4D8